LMVAQGQAAWAPPYRLYMLNCWRWSRPISTSGAQGLFLSSSEVHDPALAPAIISRGTPACANRNVHVQVRIATSAHPSCDLLRSLATTRAFSPRPHQRSYITPVPLPKPSRCAKVLHAIILPATSLSVGTTKLPALVVGLHMKTAVEVTTRFTTFRGFDNHLVWSLFPPDSDVW